MRVIFLSFEGVLHPAGAASPVRGIATNLFCWFDILASLLMQFTDVFLVVHSSERHRHSPQELGSLLGRLGDRYLGVTPPGPSDLAIREWLARHPSVNSYRILDAQPKGFGERAPLELVVCHPFTGIAAPEIQDQLRRWLRQEW